MHQDRYIDSADDLPSDTREYRFSGRSRARVSENGSMRRHLAAKKTTNDFHPFCLAGIQSCRDVTDADEIGSKHVTRFSAVSTIDCGECWLRGDKYRIDSEDVTPSFRGILEHHQGSTAQHDL